jgi:DNA-binding MarR family transcriptional regulator/histone H3/H4
MIKRLLEIKESYSLSANEFIVLIKIFEQIDTTKSENTCISNKQISEQVNLSKTSIKNVLHSLYEKELIRVHYTKAPILLRCIFLKEDIKTMLESVNSVQTQESLQMREQAKKVNAPIKGLGQNLTRADFDPVIQEAPIKKDLESSDLDNHHQKKERMNLKIYYYWLNQLFYRMSEKRNNLRSYYSLKKEKRQLTQAKKAYLVEILKKAYETCKKSGVTLTLKDLERIVDQKYKLLEQNPELFNKLFFYFELKNLFNEKNILKNLIALENIKNDGWYLASKILKERHTNQQGDLRGMHFKLKKAEDEALKHTQEYHYFKEEHKVFKPFDQDQDQDQE